MFRWRHRNTMMHYHFTINTNYDICSGYLFNDWNIIFGFLYLFSGEVAQFFFFSKTD